jgi:DNA-binding SARP family transcriptional activator/Tfp pilus assembly protein PilF
MNSEPRPELRLDVLGPLQAWLGDSRPGLGPVQQRVVLAVLAIHANRPLGREQLIEAVWGSAAPAYAVNLLQKYVSGLRRALEPVRSARAPSTVLTWTDAGYLLSMPAGCLDLEVFDREVARGRAARASEDLSAAADALHSALALWRGPAFDGLTSPLLDAERDRLAERRISVLEDRIDLDLAIGVDQDLVAELRQLVADHPLRERLRGLLMRALYRSGRQAEALTAFRDAQRYLVTELGVEPAAELTELHQRILRGDPGLAGPAAPVQAAVPAQAPVPAPEQDPVPEQAPVRTQAPAPAPALIPSQLPHAMPYFAGRRSELDQLNSLLDTGDDEAGASVVIAAIAGTAGVGKTALAVQWAHEVKHRYPDGHLYVNLRGFDPHGAAMEPIEALRGFLDVLGVPHQRIPASPEAQAALYRSLLAGRRVLVVLDNAREVDQVTPLLPDAPGCLVVVTSRRRLSGLLAVGAVPVTVGLLSRPEARQLLSRRIGQQRVDAEPYAVDEIITVSAQLPLALSIVAARATFHPQFTLAALAAELRETQGGLDAFIGESAQCDARAVLSWSYRALSDEAARLFRLLGLHPGPDFATPAAASMAGIPLAQARRLLAELSSAHLVEERTPGRFAFHDLLRAYAAERAADRDAEDERSVAQGRVFDHYLHTARAADRLLYPYRVQAAVDPPDPAVTTAGLNEPERALSWFATEHPVLLAAIDQAAETGFHAHAAQLAWTATAFLNYQGHWHDWAACLRAALEACRKLDDRDGQALANRLLNVAYQQQDQLDEAETHAREALRLYSSLGDDAGQARVHLDLGLVAERRGDFQQAFDAGRRALELYRSADDLVGEADALTAVGRYYSLLGDQEQALTCGYRSLELYEEAGASPSFQADAWHNLGYAHQQLGQHPEASRCYTRALDLWQDFGDRFEVATLLARLGDTHAAIGDHDAARAAWVQAQAIFADLGRPEAEELTQRLDMEARADRAVSR